MADDREEECSEGARSPSEDPTKLPSLEPLLARPLRVSSWPLVVIAILVTLWFAAWAAPLLIPILIALLLRFVLSPIVTFLARHHVSPALGATLCVSLAIAGLVLGIYKLAGPAAEWAETLPKTVATLREQFYGAGGAVRRVAEAAEQVQALAETEPEGGVAIRPLKVEVQDGNGVMDVLLGARELFFNAISAIVLLVFMLAADDALLRKLVSVLPKLRDKKVAVDIFRGIEETISSYLLTIIAINAVLGAAIGGALAAFGVPNAALWGVMAAFLNFIPYVGGVIGVGITAIVSLSVHGATGLWYLGPLAYIVLNFIEGTIVTPMIVGRRLDLSPAVIFIWLMVCGWIWGVVGAIIATPLLVATKVFCDRVPPLTPVGTFLGR